MAPKARLLDFILWADVDQFLGKQKKLPNFLPP
jgi:hypothetical protein